MMMKPNTTVKVMVCLIERPAEEYTARYPFCANQSGRGVAKVELVCGIW